MKGGYVNPIKLLEAVAASRRRKNAQTRFPFLERNLLIFTLLLLGKAISTAHCPTAPIRCPGNPPAPVSFPEKGFVIFEPGEQVYRLPFTVYRFLLTANG